MNRKSLWIVAFLLLGTASYLGAQESVEPVMADEQSADLQSAEQPQPVAEQPQSQPVNQEDTASQAKTPPPKVVEAGDQINQHVEGMTEYTSASEADQKMLELMSQGQYVRKSLMVLPMTFWLGDGMDPFRDRHKGLIIDMMRKSLGQMSRFDINPVPARASKRMFNYWNQMFYLSQDNRQNNAQQRETELEAMITEYLTPDLLGFMSGVMEERARKNLTEDQINSFMVDKAKESGVTASELNLVLNSGYVVVPALEYLAYGKNDKGAYEATMRGGVILYKVRVNRTQVWLEKTAKILRIGSFVGKAEDFSVLDRALMPASLRSAPVYDLVFYSALREMMASVMQDFRDRKEFRLLTQVVWSEGSDYHLPFGSSEIRDVPLNKFFETVEEYEDDDGTVKEGVTGWGFVRKATNFKYPLGKTLDTSISEYTWQAYAPKGEPMMGSIAREYSRVPVDVDFFMGMGSWGFEIPKEGFLDSIGDDVMFLNDGSNIAGGGKLNKTAMVLSFQSMISPVFSVSQLHFRIHFTYRGVVLDEEDDDVMMMLPGVSPLSLKNLNALEGGFGFSKKWWIGRVVPMLGADFRFGRHEWYGENDIGEEGSLFDYYLGARANVGLEFAFTPNVRLGITGSGLWNQALGVYTYKTDNDDGDLSYEGDGLKLHPTDFEVGAQLMINAWPLQKFYDMIMTAATKGAGGKLRQANLAPVP